MNRPATKTTYLASSDLEIFILAKNWSQDALFVVTSFLSILSTSFEFSIGHAFHLFKLIFSVVTSFVLLSEEKISKKRKSQRIPKNNDSPKIEKKRGKSGRMYRGAHRERNLSCSCVC